MIPIPVLELTLPPADQSLPPSNQENIPPRMVTPPPLNVLVPVPEENNGGKGVITQWVHGEFIVSFETICLVNVMDMVIFRTIFFELLVFFTFMLLTFHFAC